MIIELNDNFLFLADHLVMIGGFIKSPQDAVSILNIGNNTACNIAPFPRPSYAHSSAVTPIGVIACGGETPKEHLTVNLTERDCYRLTKSNKWVLFPSLQKKRTYFSMKYMDGMLWAFGGEHSKDTIEFIELKNPTKWTSRVTPFKTYGACVTELPNNRFLSIGGVENKVMKADTDIDIDVLRFFFLFEIIKIIY